MKHAGDPQRVDHVELGSADYVEVALDASCAALMALDLVRTFAADNELVAGRVSLAIAALRHAIADLREQQAAAQARPCPDLRATVRPATSVVRTR